MLPKAVNMDEHQQENKRSVTAAALVMKFRTADATNNGGTSNHSVVAVTTNWEAV